MPLAALIFLFSGKRRSLLLLQVKGKMPPKEKKKKMRRYFCPPSYRFPPFIAALVRFCSWFPFPFFFERGEESTLASSLLK